MCEQADAPSQTIVAGPRIKNMLGRYKAFGAHTHIHGLGGDQLHTAALTAEYDLFRQQPVKAWRRARAFQAGTGISAVTTLAHFLDRQTYRSWIARAAARAAAGGPMDSDGQVGDWSFRFSYPRWLTSDAKAIIATHLTAATDSAQPLGDSRLSHMSILALRLAAMEVRAAAQLSSQHDVAYEGPLLDDQVLDVYLSVHPEDLSTPTEYKPLMKLAMEGRLPARFLRRVNKISGAQQGVRGFASNYETIMGICQASPLVALGLIDIDELARCTAPRGDLPTTFVNETISSAIFSSIQRQTSSKGELPLTL
jgi:asparagine synthase (glutamine-hydrolysing)